MKSLIVGGDSCIGIALAGVLPGAVRTTRKPSFTLNPIYFDLSTPRTLPADVLRLDTAFLCAGIKGFKECERDPLSWRVNVDGILAMGKQLMRAGVFVVYVSTDAVEWSDSAYARQKAHAELGLQAFGDPAIVRCQRFDAATAPRLAAYMIEIAQARKPGIYHWSAAMDAKRIAA